MAAPSPTLLAAAGLVGGFAAARYTKRRELGGVVFAVAGAVSAREWSRRAGPVPAAALGALYTLAMGGSHPLAKQVGPGGAEAQQPFQLLGLVAAGGAHVEVHPVLHRLGLRNRHEHEDRQDVVAAGGRNPRDASRVVRHRPAAQ